MLNRVSSTDFIQTDREHDKRWPSFQSGLDSVLCKVHNKESSTPSSGYPGGNVRVRVREVRERKSASERGK